MGNSHPYRPPSIADYGGIEGYLENKAIKEKHNGLGIKDLKLRLRLGVPMSKIRDDFGLKNTGTIRRWKRMLEL